MFAALEAALQELFALRLALIGRPTCIDALGNERARLHRAAIRTRWRRRVTIAVHETVFQGSFEDGLAALWSATLRRAVALGPLRVLQAALLAVLRRRRIAQDEAVLEDGVVDALTLVSGATAVKAVLLSLVRPPLTAILAGWWGRRAGGKALPQNLVMDLPAVVGGAAFRKTVLCRFLRLLPAEVLAARGRLGATMRDALLQNRIVDGLAALRASAGGKAGVLSLLGSVLAAILASWRRGRAARFHAIGQGRVVEGLALVRRSAIRQALCLGLIRLLLAGVLTSWSRRAIRDASLQHFLEGGVTFVPRLSLVHAVLEGFFSGLSALGHAGRWRRGRRRRHHLTATLQELVLQVSAKVIRPAPLLAFVEDFACNGLAHRRVDRHVGAGGDATAQAHREDGKTAR